MQILNFWGGVAGRICDDGKEKGTSACVRPWLGQPLEIQKDHPILSLHGNV